MLAREVLRLRGTIASREADWDVMVDLFFYRDPEEPSEETKEEAKGVDEVGAAAIDAGVTNADWEVSGGAAAFAGATAAKPAGAGWDGDAADWAAAPEGTTAEWGAEKPAEQW